MDLKQLFHLLLNLMCKLYQNVALNQLAALVVSYTCYVCVRLCKPIHSSTHLLSLHVLLCIFSSVLVRLCRSGSVWALLLDVMSMIFVTQLSTYRFQAVLKELETTGFPVYPACTLNCLLSFICISSLVGNTAFSCHLRNIYISWLSFSKMSYNFSKL